MTNTRKLDFKGVLEALENHDNPELWHVRNMTHPGIGWSIKTVIPNSAQSIENIINLWHTIAMVHPDLVTITRDAFDWDGDRLSDWSTIWIRDGHDVILHGDGNHLRYEMTTFNVGLADTARETVDNLRRVIAKSVDDTDAAELGKLLEACEAMLAMMDDRSAEERRSNIRLLDD